MSQVLELGRPQPKQAEVAKADPNAALETDLVRRLNLRTAQ